MTNGKTILTQHGALGDFLLAWPGMLAVAQQALLRGDPVCWAGPANYQPFLEPLGILPADRTTKDALAACYGAATLPATLAQADIFWFGLDRCPLPESIATAPRLHFMPILEGDAPPAATVFKFLHRHGVPVVENAVEIFRGRVAAWSPPSPEDDAPVLLVPGSGHPRKCWPLERFTELAMRLLGLGQKTVLILGPNEQEQGWDKRVQDLPTAIPHTLPELQGLLRGCRAVVGNDSGPLHLAGLLGVPGVACFGPTNPRQWAPQGGSIRILVSKDTPCRPCTRTTRGLQCPRALCLEGISVDMALNALALQGDHSSS